MRLSETELLMMASALNDESFMKAKLYMVKNCVPGVTEAVEVNYLPSEQVLRLIEADTEAEFGEVSESMLKARKELEVRMLGGEK